MLLQYNILASLGHYLLRLDYRSLTIPATLLFFVKVAYCTKNHLSYNQL